jgi:Putative metallopeptidase
MRTRSVVSAGVVYLALAAMYPTSTVMGQPIDRSTIDEVANKLAASGPRISALAPADRQRLVEFMLGNTLFTLSHELGHAVISLFELPMLGPEEDAADTFATLALLHVGNNLTQNVVVDAARGLMRLAERDASLGQPPVFFDEHRLDQQRAYQIVCLMVGSNPQRFRELSERAKLTAEQQETCVDVHAQAQTAWSRVLRPHLRGTTDDRSFLRRFMRQPLPSEGREWVEIRYSEAPAALAPYRDALVQVRALERVRDLLVDNFTVPKRVTIEAKSCGEPNAYWAPDDRRLELCYELAVDFAELGLRTGP